MDRLCPRCSRRIETYSNRHLCSECEYQTKTGIAEDDTESKRSLTPSHAEEASKSSAMITPQFLKKRTSENSGDPPLAGERKRKSTISRTELNGNDGEDSESNRVRIRTQLTAEAFGFKSLSPMPSPSGSEQDEDLTVITKRPKHVEEVSLRRQFASKRFKDQVYGHIELPALCIAIMDTPQFQRLRNLKQLGAAYFVFPGASHNRFEHSIGVAWLAGVLMKRLREVQPNLGLTDRDIELVQLAGLVHDLGHGPYSHMFDGQFIPRTRPDLKEPYCHEQMTVKVLDELIRDNQIDLKQFDLDPEVDLAFVKECILGDKLPGGIEARIGRGRSKAFMYDVISNVFSGMDVDRLDYYERDARNTSVRSGCDVQRLIAESRVVDVQGRPRIVFPDKLVGDVLAAYQTRFRLHNAVYQHKVVKAIELMIVDALVAADKAKVFSYQGSDRRMYTLSTCIDDPVAFCQAQDDVLQQIRCSRSIEALGARQLMKRLDTRELYRSVGEVSIKRPDSAMGSGYFNTSARSSEFMHEMREDLEEEENPNTFTQIENRNSELYQLFDHPEEDIKTMLLMTKAAKLIELSESDVIVEKMRVHHGSYGANPLDQVYFYSKSAPNRARILSKSKYESLCPATFMKEAIRVFCTSSSPNVIAAVHDAFRELTDTRPFLSTNATPLLAPSTSPGENEDDNESDNGF